MLPKRGAVHAGVLEAGAHDSIQYCDHERIKLRLKARAKPGEVPAEKHHLVGGMATIQLLGVSSKPGRFNIDDFGTGYSSLSYLLQLPVAYIKIDQSFVRGMSVSRDSAVIVKSTIALAHSLGRKVVDEGVETQQDWEKLAALGCDIAQGYFVARPMPAENFADWALKFAFDKPEAVLQ